MEKRLVAADVYIGFVMKKSRELIALHSSKHKWLQDLERLLNQIDQQTNQCGDTLIECSKSFLCTRQISQNPYPIRILPS